jgi:hypothetical protein
VRRLPRPGWPRLLEREGASFYGVGPVLDPHWAHVRSLVPSATGHSCEATQPAFPFIVQRLSAVRPVVRGSNTDIGARRPAVHPDVQPPPSSSEERVGALRRPGTVGPTHRGRDVALAAPRHVRDAGQTTPWCWRPAAVPRARSRRTPRRSPRYRAATARRVRRGRRSIRRGRQSPAPARASFLPVEWRRRHGLRS